MKIMVNCSLSEEVVIFNLFSIDFFFKHWFFCPHPQVYPSTRSTVTSLCAPLTCCPLRMWTQTLPSLSRCQLKTLWQTPLWPVSRLLCSTPPVKVHKLTNTQLRLWWENLCGSMSKVNAQMTLLKKAPWLFLMFEHVGRCYCEAALLLSKSPIQFDMF